VSEFAIAQSVGLEAQDIEKYAETRPGDVSVRGRIVMEEGPRMSSLVNACAPIQAFRPTKRARER
jgi:hypothetical protein